MEAALLSKSDLQSEKTHHTVRNGCVPKFQSEVLLSQASLVPMALPLNGDVEFMVFLRVN